MCKRLLFEIVVSTSPKSLFWHLPLVQEITNCRSFSHLTVGKLPRNKNVDFVQGKFLITSTAGLESGNFPWLKGEKKEQKIFCSFPKLSYLILI